MTTVSNKQKWFNTIRLTNDDDLYIGIDTHKQSFHVALWLNDAPAVASKYMSEALSLAKDNRLTDAIDLWSKVLELSYVPTAQKAAALINRGWAYGKLEPPRTENEIADYTAVVEMPDATAEQKSSAHGNLGLLLFKEKNDIASLLEETTKALEYDSASYESRYNLGLVKLFSGNPDESLKLCSSAVNECAHINQIDDALNLLRSKEGILPEKSKTSYELIIQALNKHRTELEH
ncbi:MAG: hypothetical protein ABSH16_11165 [Sedimentisphaerales bacterium]